MPEVGVTHAIYFLARRERDYGEAVDALRTHAAGQTFAILVPTVRFITETLRRQATKRASCWCRWRTASGWRQKAGSRRSSNR